MRGGDVLTIDFPWTEPPLTKNKVRRLHYQTEAKIRGRAVEEARWIIRAANLDPMGGANVTLHWRMPDRRRRDGDGAQPTLSLLIDALVREGVIPDDSWVHVPHSGVTAHPPIPSKPGALWLEIAHPDQEATRA